MCMCVSYQVFSLFPLPKGPKSSPFIVEGRTRTVHVLTMRRRANRGGMSEPYGLLWRRGRRSGPSLEHWGDVLVTSDPMLHGSPWATSEQARRPGHGSLWIGGA